MSCDYPIKCKFWDGKHCIEPHGSSRFCELHQNAIDEKAIRDLCEAIDNGDIETARAIRNSPFTNLSRK